MKVLLFLIFWTWLSAAKCDFYRYLLIWKNIYTVLAKWKLLGTNYTNSEIFLSFQLSY